MLAVGGERRAQQREVLADCVFALEGMTQRPFGVERVAVAPSVFAALQVSSLNQIGDDPLRCALGDPDLERDVT